MIRTSQLSWRTNYTTLSSDKLWYMAVSVGRYTLTDQSSAKMKMLLTMIIIQGKTWKDRIRIDKFSSTQTEVNGQNERRYERTSARSKARTEQICMETFCHGDRSRKGIRSAKLSNRHTRPRWMPTHTKTIPPTCFPTTCTLRLYTTGIFKMSSGDLIGMNQFIVSRTRITMYFSETLIHRMACRWK